MDETTTTPTECSSDDYRTVYGNDSIAKLSNGFTSLYEPKLVKSKAQLHELQEKQELLHEQLHNENLQLSWTQNSVELQKMFSTIALYQGKLINIKKEMKMLHEQSTKLKKRSNRLVQHKEKLDRVQRQVQEHEQDLIAK